jgi:hypothetical protein
MVVVGLELNQGVFDLLDLAVLIQVDSNSDSDEVHAYVTLEYLYLYGCATGVGPGIFFIKSRECEFIEIATDG